MAHLSGKTYKPDATHHEAYEVLYREYLGLHDLFGRGGNDVMRRLKHIQTSARA
jgi:L-ribulokinase